MTLHQYGHQIGPGADTGGPIVYGETFVGADLVPLTSRQATGPNGGWDWAYFDRTQSGEENENDVVLRYESGNPFSVRYPPNPVSTVQLFYSTPDLGTPDMFVRFTPLTQINIPWPTVAIRIPMGERDDAVAQPIIAGTSGSTEMTIRYLTLSTWFRMFNVTQGDRYELRAVGDLVELENLTNPQTVSRTIDGSLAFLRPGTYAGLVVNSNTTRGSSVADLEMGAIIV